MLKLSRALLALSLLFFSALQAAEWQYEKTYGVIVGVLKWKDTSLSPFSDKLRKDRELHALLGKRGAKNIRLLIDAQGTKKQIEAAIREAAAAAPADGTFFFYYAGHGIQIKGGAMIAIEIFVVPGLTFVGLAGIVLVIGSLGLVTLDRWPTTTVEWIGLGSTLTTFALSLVAAVIGAICLTYYLPSIPYASRLVLKPPADDQPQAESIAAVPARLL